MVWTRTALTPGLIVIVGLLTVCPVMMLLLGSFSEGLGAFGTFTLEKYIKSYTDPALIEIIINTVVFMIGSATGGHCSGAVHGLPEHEDQYPL